MIRDELNALGIKCKELAILQDKDGVTVARIANDEGSHVIKYFQKEEHKREIENYRLLASLGIPTIQVIASTDSSLLLEDLACSPNDRLGTEEDLADPEIARRIAAWYKQLHSRGYDYVCHHGEAMYDEADFFTAANIDFIKQKTQTRDAEAWSLLEEHFDVIRGLLCKARRTLTYNDFYYTNMAVAKDKLRAMMFDYNLLGKGYAYTDVRNVLSSLSEAAGKAFLDEYGEYDPMEKALDDVVSVVVTLHLACQRERFPRWAQPILDEVHTVFPDKIKRLVMPKT